MKSTSQYLKYLLQQRAAARAERFSVSRMHDFGLEYRKPQEPLPAWAEAFGQALHRYWGGGIEQEHMPSVG
jgi:hypothetical protein